MAKYKWCKNFSIHSLKQEHVQVRQDEKQEEVNRTLHININYDKFKYILNSKGIIINGDVKKKNVCKQEHQNKVETNNELNLKIHLLSSKTNKQIKQK